MTTLVPFRAQGLGGVLITLGLVAAAACSTDNSPTSQSPPSSPSPATRAASSTSESPDAEPSASEPSPSVNDVEQPGQYCLQPADHARLVQFGPQRLLGGFLLGSGSRYVVLVHQSQGSTCEMLPLAQRLARAGFAALAFDTAGNGSSSAASADGRRVSDDVLAAVAWCRDHGARSVQLIGASMGGYGVLEAGLRARPPVAAVVSLSAPSAWDDPRGRLLDVAAMSVPTQLWAARQDSTFAQAARRFARQDPRAELHVLAGGGHGVELVPTAFSAISRFLRAALR